ncbi:MAG: response regulator [Elusimicrobia bacterium]|nr:response regulator [Elusimicrobiota bacterium]
MKSIYSKVYKDIIARMKRARKEAGLTQKDVADKLRVTQPYISKIEACQLRVDVVQLKKFAELYGKTLAYLLNDAGSSLALAEEPSGYSAAAPGAVPIQNSLESLNFAVRDPLNTVIGLSELLLKTELNQEQKRFVKDIGASSDELLRQVKEIVDSSAMAASGAPGTRRDFDLRETVEQAVRSSQSRVSAAEIEVLCCVDPDIPRRVVGDQYGVRGAVYSLFAAALDAAQEGETVSITVEQADEAAGLSRAQEGQPLQLQFVIRVAGPRRHVAEQPRGVALARVLVEKMGGVFWADSATESGCEFRFSLSFDSAAASEPSPQSMAFKGRFALLLCADREHRRIFSALCAAWGFGVEHADSLASCESLAASHTPDLLLADLLSDPQPLAACEKVRRCAALKPAKIIYLVQPSLELKAEKGESVLYGPACQNTLFESVQSLLSPAKTARQNEAPCKGKLLLAEDNSVTAKLIKYMVQENGCSLDVVARGEEAVKADSEKKYDLIIMDLRLPGIDGCEAASKILQSRASSGRKPVPIIGISADDSRQAHSSAINSGMAAFIAKPLHFAVLSGLLRRHLQKSKA